MIRSIVPGSRLRNRTGWVVGGVFGSARAALHPFGDDPCDRGSRLVGQLGRTQLVGAQQVGHDRQDPLHQRAAAHAHPGELMHECRSTDDLGEQTADLEIQPVLVIEQLRVALKGDG